MASLDHSVGERLGAGSAPAGPERRSALRVVLELGLEPYVVLDPRRDEVGRIVGFVLVFANAPACEALSRELDDLIDRSVTDLWPGSSAELVGACAQVADKGIPARLRYTFDRGQAGGSHTHEIRLFRLGQRLGVIWGDVTGQPESAGTTFQDTIDLPTGTLSRTFSRSACSRLAALDTELDSSPADFDLRSAMDSVHVGILVHDRDGLVMRSNAAAERILGVTPSQLAGRSAGDPQWRAIREDGTDIPGDEQPAMVALRSGEPVSDEVMGVPLADGSLAWILVSVTPVLGSEGAVESVVVSLRDITGYRAAQSALRAANARFDGLIDALGEPVYVLEPIWDGAGQAGDFVVAQFNPAGAQPGHIRVSGEPVSGSRLSVFYPEAEADGFAAACREALAGGDQRRLVVAWPWPGAPARQFDVTIVPFIGSNGPALAAVGRDVTAAMADREAIARAEARFRSSINALIDPVFIFTAVRDDNGEVVDLRYSHLNSAAEALYHRSAEEVIGKRLLDLFPSVVEVGAWDCYTAPLRTGEPASMRVPYFDELGVVGSFDITAAAFGDEVVVTARNITDQLAAERALAESEARFRALTENSSDIVSLHGADFRTQWVSPSVQRLLGWAPEDWLGKVRLDLIHPDDVKMARETRDELAARPELERSTRELRLLHADQTYSWWAVTVRRGPGEQGGYAVGYRDIQAQVLAREELRASENRFRLLAENASDVVILVDPQWRIQWISSSVTRVLGWASDELEGTDMAALIHPVDVDATPEATRDYFRPGSRWAVPEGGLMLRLRTKSGQYLWMAGTPTRVTDDAGQPLGFVAGLRDVDALVRSREAAQIERARLEATLDSLIDPHVMLSPVRDEVGRITDFVFTAANNAACLYNRMPREELVGTRLLEILPSHEDNGLFGQYVSVMDRGSRWWQTTSPTTRS